MFVLVPLLVGLCWGSPSTSSQRSHYGTCPEHWEKHSTSCYRYNDTEVTWERASVTCHQLYQAHLPHIRDRQENNFVEGLTTRRIWLGARLYGGVWYWMVSPYATGWDPAGRVYTDYFEQSYYSRQRLFNNPCVRMSGSGDWQPTVCDERLAFVCERTAPCGTGWYGEDCDQRCHCYRSAPCRQEDGVCPQGCQEGYSGPSCSAVTAQPEASYHCLKTTDNGLRADVTLDTKRHYYRVVKAVDEQGQPLVCPLNVVTSDWWYHVSLFLPGVFSDVSNATETAESDTDTSWGAGNVTLSPSDVATDDVSHEKRQQQGSENCVASRTDDGNVTWLIELQMFPGVRTQADVTVEVTCNLDEVDSLEPVFSVSDVSEQEDPLAAVKKRVVTSVYLADAHSEKRFDSFHLGQVLEMHVKVDGLTDQECAYPHSCVARPQDSKGKEYQITDQHGCPMRNAPIDSMRTTGAGHFISNTFSAFSLHSSSVLLECEVDVEYAGQGDCDEVCRRPDSSQG